MTDFPATISILGYLVGVVGAITVIFSRVKTENLKDLKERVDILEKDREESRVQHIENQKAISNLEGQLSTYKQIPLKSIAQSLKDLSESQKDTARTNGLILKTLDNSATILSGEKHDGGVLVKTEADKPLDVKVKE